MPINLILKIIMMKMYMPFYSQNCRAHHINVRMTQDQATQKQINIKCL